MAFQCETPIGNSMPAVHDDPNQLQPPGAGLPSWERSVLNAVFKMGCTLTSDRRALRLYQREADELLRLASEYESYDVFEQVLIPRIIGIEDSSRNWSVLMILEHLCMTNYDMLKVIKALLEGIVPQGEIDVAMYKPTPETGFEVRDHFRNLNDEYVVTIESLIENRGSLSTAERFAHPWFGPLNAHQWHGLAAVHLRLHRKQAQRLIAMLGVT